jgi:hypothetical protein
LWFLLFPAASVFPSQPESTELLDPQVEVDSFTFSSLMNMADRLWETRGVLPQACNGRLTLSSGTPVPTTDVTGASTVYFTPSNGDKLSLYSGSRWLLYTFSEKSVGVPATTTTPFDVFAYDNSGTVTLETVNWTNDTTRATGLTTQNGIWVKSGAATRRYLGTLRTTGSSGNSEDSASKRFVWNMCNRVPRKLIAKQTTANWAYTTETWRPSNNDTTAGITRVEYVVGRSREMVRLNAYFPSVNSGSATVAVGIGINSTSSNSADLYGGSAVSENAVRADLNTAPSEGYSYAQMLEYSKATGTTNWGATYHTGAREFSTLLSGIIFN